MYNQELVPIQLAFYIPVHILLSAERPEKMTEAQIGRQVSILTLVHLHL